MTPENTEIPTDDNPPVLGSWRNLYAFVLILHVILIALLYFFSQAYA